MQDMNPNTKANKTDAGNGSKAICRVSNAHPSPSPDPWRSAEIYYGDYRSSFPTWLLEAVGAFADRFDITDISSGFD
jgi:hypothetical protein